MGRREWIDGRIVLLHGTAAQILPGLPAGLVDSVITDPPYGIDLRPPRRLTSAIANDVPRYAKAVLHGVMPDLERLVRPDSAHLVFAGWSAPWVYEMLAEWYTVKSTIVWRKNVFGIGYYTRPQHEFIYYLHAGKPPVPEAAVSDVWDCAREARPVHSCQKPIGLMERCVRFVCPNDGLVLDPFAGSGSTLIGAHVANRRAIGIEADEATFELAASRIDAAIADEQLGMFA